MTSSSSRGYALLSVLAIVTALLIAGSATIGLVRTQLHFSADQIAAQGAYYVAEAGVQRGLAQLDNDVSTAATASYAYPTIPTTSFAGGSYTVTLAQDPLFPTDHKRKLITATGTLNGQQATIEAHALVQAKTGGLEFGGGGTCAWDPCAGGKILVSIGGDNRIAATVAATTNFFNGTLFSNNNTHFISGLGLAAHGAGNVYTSNNFYSDAALVLSAPMAANLYRGGGYNNSALLGLGFHFANPPGNGQGTGPGPSAGSVPQPDWEGAKRGDGSQIVKIVNQDTYSTVVPGSSWSNGIWTVNNVTLANNTRYYVEGSVNVDGANVLRVGPNSSSEIWARGVIGIKTLNLTAAGNTQSLVLVGLNDVAIGRSVDLTANVLVAEPNLSVASSTTISTGISLGTTSAGLGNRTNIRAWSQNGQAWANNATVDTLSDIRACLIGGGGNATLATTAAILNDVESLNATCS